jgi:uncharacterized protein (TIRG00374 family)
MTRALEAANGWWFVVCLFGEIVAYAGYIAAYRDFARVDGGPRMPVWMVTRVVVIGFGAYVAGSSAGTLGVDYWALHKAGDDRHTAARRVLALNTLEWGVLALAASLCGIFLLATDSDAAPVAMQVVWPAVTAFCVAAALWVTARPRVARFTHVPEREEELGRKILRGLRVALADAIGGVVFVRHTLARPLRYPFAIVGFPVFWAGDILTLWAALKAFGIDAPVAPLVLAYTTAYVVTSLPLPAGGAGGVEAGLAFSLSAVGIPLAQALLATLVYRFFTLWLPIGIAAVAVTQVKTLADELPTVPRD